MQDMQDMQDKMPLTPLCVGGFFVVPNGLQSNGAWGAGWC